VVDSSCGVKISLVRSLAKNAGNLGFEYIAGPKIEKIDNEPIRYFKAPHAVASRGKNNKFDWHIGHQPASIMAYQKLKKQRLIDTLWCPEDPSTAPFYHLPGYVEKGRLYSVDSKIQEETPVGQIIIGFNLVPTYPSVNFTIKNVKEIEPIAKLPRVLNSNWTDECESVLAFSDSVMNAELNIENEIETNEIWMSNQKTKSVELVRKFGEKQISSGINQLYVKDLKQYEKSVKLDYRTSIGSAFPVRANKKLSSILKQHGDMVLAETQYIEQRSVLEKPVLISGLNNTSIYTKYNVHSKEHMRSY
jgi:hypothetical protein